MISVLIFIGAGLLGQEAPPADALKLPQEIRLKGGRLIYGHIDEQRSSDRKLCVWPDTPWAPPKYPEYHDRENVVGQPRPEEARHHEARIKEGFQGANLRLVGARYWMAQDWVPEADYTLAQRAWEMAARVEQMTAPAPTLESASPPAEPVADAGPEPEAAENRGPLEGRGLQIVLGVVALMLLGLVTKFLIL